jgi:hypothetical protein
VVQGAVARCSRVVAASGVVGMEARAFTEA